MERARSKWKAEQDEKTSEILVNPLIDPSDNIIPMRVESVEDIARLSHSDNDTDKFPPFNRH